jgi:hypothetical protein
MSAPKNQRLTLQLIAVDNIKVDRGVQSRVALNKEFAREFMEAMLRGEVFPPVDVFFDGKRFWLADGFHRHDACRNARIQDICCRVHYGSRRDAIIFSAGANQQFSVKRSREDVERAVTLLLEDDEWFHKTDSALSNHVGCGEETVRRIRINFCNGRGIPVPEWRVDDTGTYRDTKRPARTDFGKRKIHQTKGGSFRAKLLGRKVDLGRDRAKAQRKLDAMTSKIVADKLILRPDRLPYWFLSEGIVVKGSPGAAALRGIERTFHTDQIVAVTADLSRANEIYHAIGRLFMLREYLGGVRRMVCLCIKEDGFSTQLDLAQKLGIEFLTHEELADSLKSS